MDEPAFPGCAVKARLIGVIEGEQLDGKKRIRNDRLVAVAEVNHMYANIRNLKDLPAKWLEEVQDFFVNYHDLEGKKYKLLGCKGEEVAFRLIKDAQKQLNINGRYIQAQRSYPAIRGGSERQPQTSCFRSPARPSRPWQELQDSRCVRFACLQGEGLAPHLAGARRYADWRDRRRVGNNLNQ